MSEIEFLNEYSLMNNKIENISLRSDEILEFYNVYIRISKILENEYNPKLEELFQPIKKIFYELRSSIEEYNVKLEKIFTEEDWEKIVKFINEFVLYGENYEDMSSELFQKILEIRKGVIVNKSKEWLVNLSNKNSQKSIAVIANYPEYDAEILKQFNNIILLKPNQLMKSLKLYDVLVFLGTPNFFNEFNSIFFGKSIYYLSYDIYRNKFYKNKILTPLDKKLNTLYGNVRVMTNKSESSSKSAVIEMVNENIAQKGIPEKIKGLANDSVEDDNVIEARFIRLTNGRGLIAFKNSTLRVIELNEKDNEVNVNIIRKKIRDIAPADKIIITLYTNPTFLKNYSIKQLGREKYERYVQLVNQYKNRLKETKGKLGTYQRLMREMSKNGMKITNLQVLKNWMSEKTIMPRQLEELLAFLKFDVDEIIQILEAARIINSTRIQAGMYKSRNIAKLLKKIDGESIEYNKAIYSEDNFVFSISELGKYSIETVVNVPKETIHVHTSELYKIQKI